MPACDEASVPAGLPVRYRPITYKVGNDEESQPPPIIASYFIYGICGALLPILLVLCLKLSGLGGVH